MITDNQKSVDPRVYRTEKLFQDAFLSIAKEKPVSRITVRELVDKAQVARTTFYRNYLDMPDYIEKTSNRMLEEYSQKAQICFSYPSGGGAPVVDLFTRNKVFFEHISDNSEFYRIMLGANGDPTFRLKMKHIGLDFIYQIFSETLRNLETKPDRRIRYEFGLAADSVAAAQIQTMDYWLSDDMRLSSNYVAEYQTNLSFSIFRGAGWS